VVGVPDAEWGEAVVAAVALREGTSADQADLQAHCRTAGLPSIKVPERVLTMDTLPKNAVGKIVKRAIAELAAGR